MPANANFISWSIIKYKMIDNALIAVAFDGIERECVDFLFKF